MFWSVWASSQTVFWSVWASSQIKSWSVWASSQIKFWSVWVSSQTESWSVWAISQTEFWSVWANSQTESWSVWANSQTESWLDLYETFNMGDKKRFFVCVKRHLQFKSIMKAERLCSFNHAHVHTFPYILYELFTVYGRY